MLNDYNKEQITLIRIYQPWGSYFLTKLQEKFIVG